MLSITRRVVLGLGAAVAVGMLPAAGLAQGGGGAGGSGDIVIGHYGSLTGSEATFGQSTSNGIRLAIEEVNAAGGIGGRKVSLKEYDTRGDAGEAKLAVERLVKSDRVAAVLGEVASKLSLAGGPVCQEAGVPMITPSSTNPRVTQVGDMVFRVCFIDPFQGLAGAKFAKDHLKAKSAAVLVDQAQAYAVGLAEEFEKNFQKMGGKIATRQTYTGGANDFTAQLTSIRSAKPDVIYIPGYYTDVGNIALQARKLGITQPLLGGDGWDSSELAKIGKDAIEGCYYTNHYAPDQPDARVQAFIKAYRGRFGGQTPDGLAALGYDAARILFDSIKRAGTTDGRRLRDAIAGTKAFPGVTGEITINADRDAVKSAVVVEMAGDPPEPKYVTTVKP
jgi:branched-chain amino acid transport system substrate-binding protein